MAGVRTTMGSAALTDLVPPVDGYVVGLLRRAGVVTVGTTQAPEFGPTCYTETDVVDRPAVTPYEMTRYASGSSGGSAAAVAAGLLPPEGLPVGVQLTGARHGDDALLISLAGQVERAAPFAHRHPPQW